jgi:hypothetical protein
MAKNGETSGVTSLQEAPLLMSLETLAKDWRVL